ncbi:hypothetical protein [Aliikangiella sp. IMCC44359]|uniref:hypothetical protein n=1 Tax=Aliikangiella sp. IMCC44359 TaxID=3459125 RepID=UPI00403AED5E
MSEVTVESLGFKPTNKAPSLFSLYGIGFRLYASLDKSEHSDLSIKVLYLTIFFIPVLAFGKYLIQTHEGNDYIIGKKGVSVVSKLWNSTVALFITVFIGVIAYQKYINSPDYIAYQQYKSAQVDIEKQNFSDAMRKLKSIYQAQNGYSERSLVLIKQLADNKNLQQLEPAQSLVILEKIKSLSKLFPDLNQKYITFFELYQQQHPKIAIALGRFIVNNSQDETLIKKYATKSYALLKQLFAKESGDLDLATQYAELDEKLNECKLCFSILQPFKSELGSSEAARILGQVYASQMQYENAYELLAPYVRLRLGRYHDAEKKYNNALDESWQKTIEYLNQGAAPQSFYDSYDTADKETQNQLVNELYIKRRDASPRVNEAKEQYIASTTIVPVALDLGIIMLNRALSQTDLKEREESLKAAEETFLSVKGYAGDSDDYQLYLGQVYYWLGKESEGENLFSALIDKYQRSHQVLFSLANTLRSLGAESKAKEYALEAYNSATELTDKHRYAHTLSILYHDLDEKIEWLEKSDQSNLFIKAGIHSTKGHKAVKDNNKKSALNYYQKAIDIYKTIPEDATQLNNIALIYSSKYYVGNNLNDFNLSLEYMDKAIKLVPEDSTVLLNAAHQHLEKAYIDVLSNYIELNLLESSLSLDYFSFLYRNDKEKNKFRTLLSNNASFKKALSYLQKSLLIAPKNANTLGNVVSIYRFFKMNDELEQLAQRFENISLDIESQKVSIAEYRNDINTEKLIENYKRNIKNETEKLNKNKNQPVNLAIIRSELLNNRLYLKTVGQHVDLKALIKLAELNYKEAPSSSTRGDFENVLLEKIIEKGIANSEKFSAFYNDYEKVFNRTVLVAIALDKFPEFKNVFITSAEGKLLESLLVKGYKAFPDGQSVTDWFLLQHFANPIAKEVKFSLLSDELREVKKVLYEKVSANQEQVIALEILSLLLEGKISQAKQLNKQAIADGLVFPKVSIKEV